MIFNEIYSAYYNTVAKIIACIINGSADEKTVNRIIDENAFGESMLTVLPSLKSEKWQLVKADMTTPIQHIPTMPLTTIQKRWLKAISLDPRIKLFDIEFNGLDEVEPLFTPEDYYIYDKYGDGDPFESEEYIKIFRTVLSAQKEERTVKIRMINRKNDVVSMTVIPQRIEYSEKDDKFRVIGVGKRFTFTVNLARIVSCEYCADTLVFSKMPMTDEIRTVTLKIYDERNALERTMLHFAHFEKRAERIAKDQYLVHIKYDKSDETEMVIRILGFGPMVEVTEPADFRSLIIERLKSQKSCELI